MELKNARNGPLKPAITVNIGDGRLSGWRMVCARHLALVMVPVSHSDCPQRLGETNRVHKAVELSNLLFRPVVTGAR